MARSPAAPAADAKLAAQLRETRATLLEQLAAEPDDLATLFLASVFSELDPDGDATLAAHAARFTVARARLGDAGFRAEAEARGLAALLWNLGEGLRHAGFGQAAEPVLARRLTELPARPAMLVLLAIRMDELGQAATREVLLAALRALDARLAQGMIDASFVPEALHSVARYHASGHLAEVVVAGGPRHQGKLVLAEAFGAGKLWVMGHRGGSGFVIDERYEDGQVLTTFNSPWHDGVESREAMPWARWVAQGLSSLVEAAEGAASAPPKRPKPKRRPSTRSKTGPSTSTKPKPKPKPKPQR
ncbi:MAG: hypothetical protein IT370_32910 [Deltaproteobacteria bacterium]|nr:hypothetical protein [Deltaproteobacteria bacterium]